jgi:hypothetical protein
LNSKVPKYALEENLYHQLMMIVDFCHSIVRKVDLVRIHKIMISAANCSRWYRPANLPQLLTCKHAKAVPLLYINRFIEFDATKEQW